MDEKYQNSSSRIKIFESLSQTQIKLTITLHKACFGQFAKIPKVSNYQLFKRSEEFQSRYERG